MNKKFYITTPIYYPSAKPHMGHAYSSIIADIFARFKRLENYDVLFLTGTDEHGQKIQKEAKKNNKDPKIFCDELSETFRSLTKILNLSNNDFIRTTEKRHFKSVENLSSIRALVLGDLIVDRYVDCQPIGMSAEDPTVVVSPIAEEKFIGGAGIVSAHASNLGASTVFVSVRGNDETGVYAETELQRRGVKTEIIADADRPTTQKTRFRANNKTLLRVNELRDHQVDPGRDMAQGIDDAHGHDAHRSTRRFSGSFPF